jgi:tetratricopeptide (TPR) repeat protein
MRRVVAGVMLALAAAVALAAQLPENARLALARYKEGVDQMRVEQWEEAAESFKAAFALDPHMVLAAYNLGQCRMAQKRFVEAVAAYKTARTAFEDLSTLSQKERGQRDRARRDEINALRDSLARLHTMTGKGITEMAYQTRFEDRIRLLESMEMKGDTPPPVPAEMPLALGSAYFRQEKLEDAERAYREAVSLNPKLGAAHNNLAVICLLTGRVDEAEAETRLAEESGFKVNPRLKEDIARAKATPRP